MPISFGGDVLREVLDCRSYFNYQHPKKKEKAKKEFEAYDHSKTGFIHIDDASSALIGKFFIRN